MTNPDFPDSRVRPCVARILNLGPLPGSQEATEAILKEFEAALEGVSRPLSHREAIALLASFGDDDCFGLAWTLLHLMESAPPPLLENEPDSSANEWVRLLWLRQVNTFGPPGEPGESAGASRPTS